MSSKKVINALRQQRDLSELLATLRRKQKNLVIPPNKLKSIAVRYDPFTMSEGMRHFNDNLAPLIAYANPSLPFHFFQLAYEPSSSSSSSTAGSSSSASSSTTTSNSTASSSKTAEPSTSSSPSAFASSSGEAEGESSGASATMTKSAKKKAATSDTEVREIPRDPNDIDAEIWRARFRDARDRLDSGHTLPSEIILNFNLGEPQMLEYNGLEGEDLLQHIISAATGDQTLLQPLERTLLIEGQGETATTEPTETIEPKGEQTPATPA